MMFRLHRGGVFVAATYPAAQLKRLNLSEWANFEDRWPRPRTSLSSSRTQLRCGNGDHWRKSKLSGARKSSGLVSWIGLSSFSLPDVFPARIRERLHSMRPLATDCQTANCTPPDPDVGSVTQPPSTTGARRAMVGPVWKSPQLEL